jgi:hypothetical protein
MRPALFVAAVWSLAVGCTNASVSTPAPVQGTAATVATATIPSPGNQLPIPQGPTAEQVSARNDSLVADRTKHVNEVLASIAGKEQMPAEQVYKNIQMFKGMQANRLLAIMNRGFSNSLGVSCSHCHVVGEYDKEDKPQKQIAREMARMDSAVNAGYLAKIQHLKSKQPIINCTTCHRGSPKPALNLH